MSLRPYNLPNALRAQVATWYRASDHGDETPAAVRARGKLLGAVLKGIEGQRVAPGATTPFDLTRDQAIDLLAWATAALRKTGVVRTLQHQQALLVFVDQLEAHVEGRPAPADDVLLAKPPAAPSRIELDPEVRS